MLLLFRFLLVSFAAAADKEKEAVGAYLVHQQLIQPNQHNTLGAIYSIWWADHEATTISTEKITTAFDREKIAEVLWKSIRGPKFLSTGSEHSFILFGFDVNQFKHLLIGATIKKEKLSLAENSAFDDLIANSPWNIRIWITVKSLRLSRCNTLAGFCFNWPVSFFYANDFLFFYIHCYFDSCRVENCTCCTI